jgi:ribonucleoside-triphosphate reductase
LTIAENTIKQYMLQEVFSKEVANAHLKGWIHIHDLGYPRIYCSGHSLEYLKKYGLKLENLDTSSAPAKHTRTLTGHLNTFLASMQAYYAGALGIGFLNIIYAPFLVNLPFKEIKQEAQYLIFSGSQNAFSRGGQSLFLDFNVHLGIPEYLKDVPAIGPGGEYTGKNYGEYEIESQLFLKALMEVWKEGDCNKKVFAFPKMDLHINNRSFEDPEQKKLLEYACEVASENGSPYFIFDRDDISLASCCRLRTRITDQEMITHPEKLRFAGIQNVTINLPQCAYRAFSNRGISESSFNYSKMENIELFFEKIDQVLHLAIQAHLQKKKFLKMMMVNSDGALWEIGKIAEDGKPYVDLDQGTYLIGLIGLNEAVQYISGDQLHESEKAYKLGLKIVSFMSLKCEEYSEKFNLKLSLEESPAESAAGRLAKIDLQEFPDSKKVIKGNPERDEIYYTNSIHFAASAPLDLITRIVKQSKFHPLIKSGAIIHAFVGENRPSSESIYNLIKKVWENTQCSQLTISPEFTICNLCNKVSRGLTENCNDCGSKDVYGVTRIVGYYSKITNWNKNKIGELKDRHSGNYKVKSQV